MSNIWKPKLEKKTYKFRKKELNLNNGNHFKTQLNTGSEEYLNLRVKMVKDKLHDQIDRLESDIEPEQEFEILKQDALENNYPTGDTEIEKYIASNMRSNALGLARMIKSIDANQLRDLLNLESSRKFYLICATNLENFISKFSSKSDDLKKWEEVLELGLKKYPNEVSIYVALNKIYKRKSDHNKLIKLCIDLLNRFEKFDDSLILNDEKFIDLDRDTIERYKMAFLHDIIFACAETSQYELGLKYTQKLHFREEEFLYNLKKYEELSKLLYEQYKLLKSELIKWEPSQDNFIIGLTETLPINQDFVNIFFKKISNALKLVYINRYTGVSNRKLYRLYNLSHRELNTLISILDDKKFIDSFKFEIYYLKLNLGYLSLVFGEYETALAIYKSIDPLEYFDVDESNAGRKDTKTKEEGQDKINSTFKLLTANDEGKDMLLSLELGKAVCYLELNEKEIAHRLFDSLIESYKETYKSERNEDILAKDISVKEFNSCANFLTLQENVSKLNQQRNDYFNGKLEYSAYLDAINQIVDWIRETYLNKFTF